MQFSRVITPYPFDCANAWRLISFVSNISNLLVRDFSDFTNKHVAQVTYLIICAIFTYHCRRISVIMKPASWLTAFIHIKYGSKNWQQWYRQLQVIFLILLSTSYLLKTVIFVSITSSIIIDRIPMCWPMIRIFSYPQ